MLVLSAADLTEHVHSRQLDDDAGHAKFPAEPRTKRKQTCRSPVFLCGLPPDHPDMLRMFESSRGSRSLEVKAKAQRLVCEGRQLDPSSARREAGV